MITAPAIDDSNVQAAALRLAWFLWNRSLVFQGPVMEVWGSDFRFQQAQNW
jgi:hypothetical protein